MHLKSVAGNMLLWAKRNERRLGAVLFAFGFAIDFFTFVILPFSVVNLIFVGYLVLAAVSTLGAHAFAQLNEHAPWWKRALSVIFPLGVQYAFGGLLSGFVVFYASHSVLTASWPFLIVLLLVYVGNEYFRMYKHYLIFQTSLFFFSLYAYTIFGLPLLVKSLGPLVFLGSTLATVVIFGVFLYLLWFVNKIRFDEEFRSTLVTAGITVVLVSSSYFLGVIPPLPLAIKDAGIFHSLIKSEGMYKVTAEPPRVWWDIRPPVVHVGATDQLYAFSAVAAPIAFGSVVVHRWERRDENHGWVTQSKIAFPITGGRGGGYRGYSVKGALIAGEWRLSVETQSGQVIGRIRFDVDNTSTPAVLEEKIL